MVLWGPVVWIRIGSPYEKGCYLGAFPRIRSLFGPQTINTHHSLKVFGVHQQNIPLPKFVLKKFRAWKMFAAVFFVGAHLLPASFKQGKTLRF